MAVISSSINTVKTVNMKTALCFLILALFHTCHCSYFKAEGEAEGDISFGGSGSSGDSGDCDDGGSGDSGADGGAQSHHGSSGSGHSSGGLGHSGLGGLGLPSLGGLGLPNLGSVGSLALTGTMKHVVVNKIKSLLGQGVDAIVGAGSKMDLNQALQALLNTLDKIYAEVSKVLHVLVKKISQALSGVKGSLNLAGPQLAVVEQVKTQWVDGVNAVVDGLTNLDLGKSLTCLMDTADAVYPQVSKLLHQVCKKMAHTLVGAAGGKKGH